MKRFDASVMRDDRDTSSECSPTKTKLKTSEGDLVDITHLAIHVSGLKFIEFLALKMQILLLSHAHKTEMKVHVRSSKGCDCWEHSSFEWEKQCLSASRGC